MEDLNYGFEVACIVMRDEFTYCVRYNQSNNKIKIIACYVQCRKLVIGTVMKGVLKRYLISCTCCLIAAATCNLNFVIKLNSAIKGINIRAHTCLYCIGYLVNISSSVFCNSTTLRLLQADSDFYVMAELLKDYIGLIQAVKVSVITSC